MMERRRGESRTRLLPKIVIDVAPILHLIGVDEGYADGQGSHDPLAVYYMSL
jgi:hypothetical protein